MKCILRTACLALAVATILVSCKNRGAKEARYIPKEASMVFVMDAGQMQDKLQQGGISTDSLIARVFKNEPADSKTRAEFNELRNNSGINWESRWYIFMLQKAYPDKSSGTTFSVLGSLKDEQKLEAYLKTQKDTKTKTIQKEKDFSYLQMEGNTMLAWNKENVILTVFNHAPKFRLDTGAAAMDQPAPAVDAAAELKTQVTKYFTQQTKESLADQPIFTDMFKEKADGYVYSSTNNASNYLSLLPVQLPKLDEFIKDNYFVSTLHFEDGKVVAKSTSYPNPMVSNLLKQYAGPTINLSMLDKYPSANLNGFALAAVNPQIIGGLLKQLDLEGFVNVSLSKTGLTSEDLYKAFKGEFALMVSDIGMMGIEPQMKTDEKDMITKKPWGKLIADLPIGDKASFDKIMAKAVEMGGVVRTPDGGYKGAPMLSSMGIYIAADTKSLVIASDSLTYAQYKSGTAKSTVKKDVLKKLEGGKITAFYFDIAATLNTFAKDSVGDYHNSVLTAKNTFRDAIMVTDAFDGKTLKGEAELRLLDEKQNSLVTLTRLFTDIAVDMRLRASKMQDSKLFPGGVPAIIRTN